MQLLIFFSLPLPCQNEGISKLIKNFGKMENQPIKKANGLLYFFLALAYVSGLISFGCVYFQ